MKFLKYLALSTAIFGLSSANAEMLTYSFNDAIGDQSRLGYSDLSKISVVFDNATGNYTISLEATAEQPFTGWLDVDANMVNPDTPVFNQAQSYFFKNNVKINLASSTTSVLISGTSASLMYWKAGDRVASSSVPFGIAKDAPPSSFTSAMDQGVVYTQYSTDEFPNTQIATITTVPEPTNAVLLLSGLIAVWSIRRRNSSSERRVCKTV